MVWQDRSFVRTDVLTRDGKVAATGTDIVTGPETAETDLGGKYLVPGFMDIHTHGAAGVDVNAATAEDLEKISEFFASQGTTAWLCSVLTDTKEQTEWCIDQVKQWKKLEHRGAELLGIHLEGPFLAPEYKGAMPEQLLRKADLALLAGYQERAAGLIRYITVSPEVEGIPEMIPEIRKLGIHVAIGHSGADYETAVRAIRNGAESGTHVGNAMRLFDRHEPAIWGAILEADDVYAEAICDGRHLHPGAVRLYLKTKGNSRVIAVTDSIMAAGLPDGRYKLGVNDVTVKDGDARLTVGNARAGSTLTMAQALKNLLKFTGKPLEYVLPLMTGNPATLLGVGDAYGTIRAGSNADFNVVDRDGTIYETWCRGRKFTG